MKPVFCLFMAVIFPLLVSCEKSAPDLEYDVTVDYDRGIEAGVKAGRYDGVYQTVTYPLTSLKGIPPIKSDSTRSGQVKVKIVIKDLNESTKRLSQFGFISAEDALRELEKANLRPINLPELLALGEQSPELQKEFEFGIVAFDQSYNNGRNIIIAHLQPSWEASNKWTRPHPPRRLRFSIYDPYQTWRTGDHRFAGVPKGGIWDIWPFKYLK